MMFDKLCIDLIRSGNKTATRRIKRNNKRPAKPGSIHKLKIDRTKNTYGYIEIEEVTTSPYIWVITDEQAKDEGFNDAQSFLDYWESVNPEYHNEWVWVVKFKYLGDDKNVLQ